MIYSKQCSTCKHWGKDREVCYLTMMYSKANRWCPEYSVKRGGK